MLCTFHNIKTFPIKLRTLVNDLFQTTCQVTKKTQQSLLGKVPTKRKVFHLHMT